MASISKTYSVAGLTCGHCVASVSDELAKIDGVISVSIALHAGTVSDVTVSSTSSLARDQVAQAIDRAGYQLVDS